MRYLLPAIALCALSACATITQGTRDALVIETTPQGASVLTSNGYSCDSTPCALEMPKKHGFIVTLTKEGCETKNVNVVTKMAKSGGAAVAGNVLVGGVIGLGVDAISGAAKELVPNQIKVNLEC